MSKKNNRLSNQVFELGVELCLAPINFLLRALPYPAGVIASVISICLWAVPIMIVFSIISNLIFLAEIVYKLIKK
jgi:hypothetical protein